MYIKHVPIPTLDAWVASRLIKKQFYVFFGGVTLCIGHINKACYLFNGFMPVILIIDS
jgi:hypothetical protein